MKVSVALLLLALSLAFGAGYIVLQVRQSEGHQFGFSVSEINAVKRRFREKNTVVGELDAANLFSPQAGLELIDPRSVLSPSRGKRFAETASVFRAEKFCRPDFITETSLSKIKTWISYRCGRLRSLPQDFFARAPFMSPTGISFANLAILEKQDGADTEEWIKQNIQFFHSMELKSLSSKAALDPARKIASDLGQDVLLAMTSGQDWIGDERYILARKKAELSGDFQRSTPTVDYLVYSRKDWDYFLSSYEIETTGNQSAGCRYREDGLCWVKASSSERRIQWVMCGLLLLVLGLIGFCVLQIIRNIRNQRLQDERKRFALQAITHELRTPLASLVVSSEQVLNQFESLPALVKEPFLRMADDVQRLTRVAESSRNYLNAGDSTGLITFDFVEVPSINDFVCSVLERYADEITIQKLEQDESFHLDQYWVGTCIQNLVQNALQHGRKPVVVSTRRENGALVISVSDAGSLAQASPTDLVKPFFKRSRSSGLGLGLAIIHTVMNAMNSTLRIQTHPTRFELWIGERS